MISNNDRDLKEWAADWQAAAPAQESTEQIRRYVKRRSRMLWSFAVADVVIVSVTLPILAYFAWFSRSDIERMAMIGLSTITIATACFGWWNWSGVLRSSASSVSEYVAISAERLRRLRLASRIGWFILAGEDALFTIWIWEQLYSGRLPYDARAERFAWGLLSVMTIAAVTGLLYFGRWIRRDTERFDALRRELERD